MVIPECEQSEVFNSLNDIVLHRGSGSLLFTDPAYGAEVQVQQPHPVQSLNVYES